MLLRGISIILPRIETNAEGAIAHCCQCRPPRRILVLLLTGASPAPSPVSLIEQEGPAKGGTKKEHRSKNKIGVFVTGNSKKPMSSRKEKQKRVPRLNAVARCHRCYPVCCLSLVAIFFCPPKYTQTASTRKVCLPCSPFHNWSRIMRTRLMPCNIWRSRHNDCQTFVNHRNKVMGCTSPWPFFSKASLSDALEKS